MCGIGGVMMFPKDRYGWELEYIRNLVKVIAVENQKRGSDATGVVAFNKEDTKLFKAAEPARKFVNTTTYNRFAEEVINYYTHSVLVHTRAGTKGHESNNNNNHPIESHKFIGVHNGMIYNDDELFDKEKLFRLAEVDSEIIFRLHDRYGDTIDGIKQAAEKLQGGFTYSFASKEKRNILHLVRNSNPVVMALIPNLNIIIFASEKRFLQTAIEEANISFGYHEFITDGDCTWFEPKAKTIMSFDTNEDNALEQLCQDSVSFAPSTMSWSSYDEDWIHDETYGWRYVNKPKAYVKKNEAKEDTIEEVLSWLTEANCNKLMDFIEAEKEMSWNLGWSAGRSSLDEAMQYSRGLAFEQGYEKGIDEGRKEAKEIKEEAQELLDKACLLVDKNIV